MERSLRKSTKSTTDNKSEQKQKSETPQERQLRKKAEREIKKMEETVVNQEKRGYLENTKSSKMKTGEKIVREADYEPDFTDVIGDPDEDYEEDFDDYEDDFEEIEFETKLEAEHKNQTASETKQKSKSTTPNDDFERIQNSIKNENKRISSAKHDSMKENRSPSPTPDYTDKDSRSWREPLERSPQAAVFNFTAGSHRRRNANAWARAREIQKLITLDITHDTVLRINQESGYSRFMKLISQNDKACISVGTDDDRVDRDIQTDTIDTDDSWTQNQISAKTQHTMHRTASHTKHFSLLPVDVLQSAANVAHILLEEIEEEMLKTKLSQQKNISLAINENVLAIDTDWNKIAIVTDQMISVYTIANLTTPLTKVNISARAVKIWKDNILIGSSHGSIIHHNISSNFQFSTDCYNDGHMAAIHSISHYDGDEIVSADIFGGVRKWSINTQASKFEVLQSIDFDQNLYDIKQDRSRVFVALFNGVEIINSQNFHIRMGSITTNAPCLLAVDEKSNRITASTETAITIYDLSSKVEQTIIPCGSRFVINYLTVKN